MKNKGITFLLIYVAIFGIACENIDEDRILSPFSKYWRIPPKYDDSGATKFLNVAAVSFHVDTSPAVNRNKIVAFIDAIKSEQPNVRLILFSEAALGYYFRTSNPAEYQKSIAETIPGETTNMISLKALEHNIYISFGMVEKSEGDLYVSQVLISPDGSIKSVSRKYYLTPEDKKSGFKAGNTLVVDVIDNIKIATIICNDLNNLTLNKMIHASGAELVLLPEATARAVNSIFLTPSHTYTWYLGANRIGREDGMNYDGRLYLSTPSGEHRIMENGKEGYIYGVVKCR